jgi:hypothetical protein
MSDTGQSSEAPEFLPQPYIDPYTKRWVCPEPVKVVDGVHIDAELEDAHPGQNDSDHSLSHQNDTIDFENEISNEVRSRKYSLLVRYSFILGSETLNFGYWAEKNKSDQK